MSRHDQFELRRQSDELVYRFDRMNRDDGRPGYKRSDADLWIIRSDEFGWVAIDEVSGVVTGRPLNVAPEGQTDHPPEDDWDSRKGTKFYIYSLVYTTAPDRSA